MENMILPVQIFLASRDLQYDFPKIGWLRSPVCNFIFTFVQVWLPNLRSQHFVPNLFSQKNRTYRQLFQFILNEKMSGLALISSKSGKLISLVVLILLETDFHISHVPLWTVLCSKRNFNQPGKVVHAERANQMLHSALQHLDAAPVQWWRCGSESWITLKNDFIETVSKKNW